MERFSVTDLLLHGAFELSGFSDPYPKKVRQVTSVNFLSNKAM